MGAEQSSGVEENQQISDNDKKTLDSTRLTNSGDLKRGKYRTRLHNSVSTQARIEEEATIDQNDADLSDRRASFVRSVLEPQAGEDSSYRIPQPNPFFWLTTTSAIDLSSVAMRAKSCGPIIKHPSPDYADRVNRKMPHEFYDSNVIVYLEVGGKLYSSTLKTLANDQRNGRLLGGIIKKCVGWDKKTVYRVNCEKEHDSNGNYRYKREADFFGMGKLKALVKKKIEEEREKIRAQERRDEQRDAAMKLLLEEIIRLRREVEATRSNSEDEWQENIIL